MELSFASTRAHFSLHLSPQVGSPPLGVSGLAPETFIWFGWITNHGVGWMELTELINKKVKATKPNGSFAIGVLLSINATHAEIRDGNTGEILLLPIAVCEFKEAW